MIGELNCHEGNFKLIVISNRVNSLFADHNLVHREKREWESGPCLPDGDWMKNVAKLFS